MGGSPGFSMRFVFPWVTINGDIMMWFIGSQDNCIQTLKYFNLVALSMLRGENVF